MLRIVGHLLAFFFFFRLLEKCVSNGSIYLNSEIIEDFFNDVDSKSEVFLPLVF